jgi:hypothetical protein
MDKKMKQFPPLTEEQRGSLLLLMKFLFSGDLSCEEWQSLKNSFVKAGAPSEMSLEKFIATMKAEAPAYLYHLRHKHRPAITEEELALWCLTNNLPLD